MEARRWIEQIWSEEILSRSPSLALRPFQSNENHVAESNSFTSAANPLLRSTTSIQGTAIPSRLKQSFYIISLFIVAALLSTFVCYYVYQTLVSATPALGKLLFSASTTVFAVNILSQGVQITINTLFGDLFEAMRWQLASRRTGVSIKTFLGLSGSTPRIGIGMLLGAKGTHRFWCFQK